MKLLLSLLMLFTLATAQDKLTTTKTSCIQQSLYPNKTLDEQKKILVEKAKQESLEELYGTLISSSTDIQNGKIVNDKIRSRAVGAVRVNGNPSFYNGKNLGEICTDVKVYITKKDLAKYSPKKVSLTHYCFNDPSVAMKDIKTEAKYGAYKEIISQYKPSMQVTGKQAEQFIHGFTISNDKFDFDTASYCFNAVVTILPYELEVNRKIENNIEKKDLFQGVWEGYAKQGSGLSWSIKVKLINDMYQISYPSLRCGGDLLLINKNETSMKFQEKIKYGSGCVNNGTLVLKLITKNDDAKLSFDWYYPSGKHDAHTTLLKIK